MHVEHGRPGIRYVLPCGVGGDEDDGALPLPVSRVVVPQILRILLSEEREHGRLREHATKRSFVRKPKPRHRGLVAMPLGHLRRLIRRYTVILSRLQWTCHISDLTRWWIAVCATQWGAAERVR